jgi:hypothetical protein
VLRVPYDLDRGPLWVCRANRICIEWFSPCLARSTRARTISRKSSPLTAPSMVSLIRATPRVNGLPGPPGLPLVKRPVGALPLPPFVEGIFFLPAPVHLLVIRHINGSHGFRTAVTIARIPALTGSGRPPHASTTSIKSSGQPGRFACTHVAQFGCTDL